jgi:hypothetical protein
MNKSHKDGMDLMVNILQNVLQLYAGRHIYETRRQIKQKQNDVSTSNMASQLFDTLLQTDADQWDTTIRKGIATPGINNNTETTSSSTTIANELIVEIQRYMESVILSYESGSMTQRVLAEYFQELIKRIESIQQQQRQQ